MTTGRRYTRALLIPDASQVYLDFNATTPLDTEVTAKIQDALVHAWGNPSSSHLAGERAKKLIESSRKSVAEMIGTIHNDIVFTSGGTESSNLVFHSAINHFKQTVDNKHDPNALKAIVPHIITTNIEHDSVKLPLHQYVLEGKAEISVLPVSKVTGSIHPGDVVSAIRTNTCLVTVMLANNETGIIQPIREIANAVRSMKRDKGDSDIFVHTDAAQAIGKIPVDVEDLGVDYLTIAGHKFYGPRIGALYCRDPGQKTPLHPMFYGGGQERGFRPGLALFLAFMPYIMQAADLVIKNIELYSQHMAEIRNYLEEGLQKQIGSTVHLNRKNGMSRLPNTCSVSFIGRNLKGFEVLSRTKKVQASTGAACHSNNMSSRILLSSGFSEEIADSAIRLSVGRETTKADIDLVIEDLKSVISHK